MLIYLLEDGIPTWVVFSQALIQITNTTKTHINVLSSKVGNIMIVQIWESKFVKMLFA